MNKPVDQVSLRKRNLSSVLRVIHRQSPVSRAQLAVITGLNKSTISSIVDELIARQIIHETGSTVGAAGRPATWLAINPAAGLIIGAEFGVDFVSVAVADLLGNTLWRYRENANPTGNQQQMIDQMLGIIRQAMSATHHRGGGFWGLGLSIPGTVDPRQGMLIFAPNLQWHNVPLRQIFEEQTGLKVHVENDANAAAIAEHLFGAAQDTQNFVLVYIGFGIGGGLFLNGKLYRGKNGFAGEIGHYPVMAGAGQTICHCGNDGCWETHANQNALLQRVKSRLEMQSDNSIIIRLMETANSQLDIAIIKEAADKGDKVALDCLRETGIAVGRGFAGLINIFNPEKIILGGPLSAAGKYLFPPLKEVILRRCLPEFAQQTEVALSSFGADASLFGAIAIVVDDVLKNPLSFQNS